MKSNSWLPFFVATLDFWMPWSFNGNWRAFWIWRISATSPRQNQGSAPKIWVRTFWDLKENTEMVFYILSSTKVWKPLFDQEEVGGRFRLVDCSWKQHIRRCPESPPVGFFSKGVCLTYTLQGTLIKTKAASAAITTKETGDQTCEPNFTIIPLLRQYFGGKHGRSFVESLKLGQYSW